MTPGMRCGPCDPGDEWRSQLEHVAAPLREDLRCIHAWARRCRIDDFKDRAMYLLTPACSAPLPFRNIPARHNVLDFIRAEASQQKAQPQNFGSAVKLAAVGLAAASLLHGVAPAQAGVILTKREVKKVSLCGMSILAAAAFCLKLPGTHKHAARLSAAPCAADTLTSV